MMKFVVLATLLAVGQAQVLRVSPLNIGSTQPGQQQVILLALGGGLGSGPVASTQTVRTISQPQSVRVVQAAPVRQTVRVVQAAPQPQFATISVAQPQVVSIRGASLGGAGLSGSSFGGSSLGGSSLGGAGAALTAGGSQSSGAWSQFSSAARGGASASGASADDEKPSPFAFAFDSEDEFGTKIGRQESGSESGVVTGSYTLSDANGIARVVTYTADETGFHAQVQTNEPGTLTSNPADVQVTSSSASRR